MRASDHLRCDVLHIGSISHKHTRCAQYLRAPSTNVRPTASVLNAGIAAYRMLQCMTYHYRTILGTEVNTAKHKHVPTDTESMHRLDDERLPLPVRTIASEHMQLWNQ
jgi:hypothetical protein